MTFELEYDAAVTPAVKCRAQRLTPAPQLLFSIFLVPLLLVSASLAQFSSANSSGSSHSISSAPPTAAPFTHSGSLPSTSWSTGSGFSHDGSAHHHYNHSAAGDAYYPYYPYGYAVPVPYAADDNDNDMSDDDSDYQGGPTIFDRRGSGRNSYIPALYPGPAHALPAHAPKDQPVADSSIEDASGSQPLAANPESPKVPTTLVFKDGHQLEVDNYAIVTQTLYDLTPGHPRKIALADLDLSATQKENDDRGIDFQLPPLPQAN